LDALLRQPAVGPAQVEKLFQIVQLYHYLNSKYQAVLEIVA
jgi:hypothetical protein